MHVSQLSTCAIQRGFLSNAIEKKNCDYFTSINKMCIIYILICLPICKRRKHRLWHR